MFNVSVPNAAGVVSALMEAWSAGAAARQCEQPTISPVESERIEKLATQWSEIMSRRAELPEWERDWAPDEVFYGDVDIDGGVEYVNADAPSAGVFSVSARLPKQLDQLGRALATVDLWEVIAEWSDKDLKGNLPVRLPHMENVIRGYMLQHKHTGRLIAAILARSKANKPYAVTLEWNVDDQDWREHRVQGRVCNDTFRSAGSEFVVAWTKYHLIAKLATGARIQVLGNVDIARSRVEDAFRRETWSHRAGFRFEDWKVGEALVAENN